MRKVYIGDIRPNVPEEVYTIHEDGVEVFHWSDDRSPDSQDLVDDFLERNNICEKGGSAYWSDTEKYPFPFESNITVS